MSPSTIVESALRRCSSRAATNLLLGTPGTMTCRQMGCVICFLKNSPAPCPFLVAASDPAQRRVVFRGLCRCQLKEIRRLIPVRSVAWDSNDTYVPVGTCRGRSVRGCQTALRFVRPSTGQRCSRAASMRLPIRLARAWFRNPFRTTRKAKMPPLSYVRSSTDSGTFPSQSPPVNAGFQASMMAAFECSPRASTARSGD